MKFTVFGSTGRTGRLVVSEALRRGHDVTAFTRRPEALRDDTRRLTTVVPGDGRDPGAVHTAVSGADAIIAIVSPGRRAGPHQTAAVARVIVDQMNRSGVRRLIATSAYPLVGDSPRVPMALLRLIFADSYADAAAMEHIVSATDLDWTIARLNRLTDKPATGGVRMTSGLFDRPTGLTRADAAATLLDIIADGTTIRNAVNVAGPRPRLRTTAPASGTSSS